MDKDTDDRCQNSKDSSRGGTSQYPRDGYGSSRDQYPRDGYRHNRNMSHRSCYYRLKENFDKWKRKNPLDKSGTISCCAKCQSIYLPIMLK